VFRSLCCCFSGAPFLIFTLFYSHHNDCACSVTLWKYVIVMKNKSEAQGGKIQSHEELEVYRLAFEAAMRIFEKSKQFPIEERFSLTDQMRRSSRSVCSNIAEAWRKRRYEAAFVSKLSDAEAEAAETQTWLRFAMKCDYLAEDAANGLHLIYDNIIGKLVRMITNPYPWLLSRKEAK